MAKINILEYIPYGEDNAVTRHYLTSVLGLTDRNIRQMIEDARKQGAIIINKQDGRGYYQSDLTHDLLHQYRSSHSRVMGQLQQLSYLRRELQGRGVSVKW